MLASVILYAIAIFSTLVIVAVVAQIIYTLIKFIFTLIILVGILLVGYYVLRFLIAGETPEKVTEDLRKTFENLKQKIK
jgi:CHASE2 domain-containing sensor protein